MSKIEIDRNSGTCFGVARAINRVEEELENGGTLYCLGDIVHNSVEVERLEKLGMVTINHDQLKELRDVRVLLRAHGEPPSTYEIAKQNNIELIDATCPVVLGLQRRIKKKHETQETKEAQIVIFGKKGHAEVNGLMGQTEDNAIIIEDKDDLHLLNFSENITLFSQTTKPLDGFAEISEMISERMEGDAKFESFDTICRQVSNRVPNMHEFAKKHDIVFFIAGRKSSNGRVLFEECKKHNPNSYMLHHPDQLDESLVKEGLSTGICGATSTPMWQMEAVAENLKRLLPTGDIEEVTFE